MAAGRGGSAQAPDVRAGGRCGRGTARTRGALHGSPAGRRAAADGQSGQLAGMTLVTPCCCLDVVWREFNFITIAREMCCPQPWPKELGVLTVYMSAGPWSASCGKSCLSGASHGESRLSGASYGESRLSGAGRKPAHCAVGSSAGPNAATAEFRICGPPWWGSLNRRGWHLHQHWHGASLCTCMPTMRMHGFRSWLVHAWNVARRPSAMPPWIL